MHYLYAPIEYQGAPFLAKITIEEYNFDNKKRAYNAQRIKLSTLSRAQYSQLKTGYRGKYASSVDAISISDLYKLVKTFDKDFSAAPETSPLLLNKDGTPKVFYHGSNSEFTVFDLTKAGSNFGEVAEGMFFFTDKKQAYPNSAKDYAREAVKNKGGSEQIYEVYISMHKPLVIDSRFSYDPVSYYDANQERIYEQYFNGDYDGIIVRDSTGKSSTSTLAMVDNTSQIKSATDNIGTFSKGENDIRYSRELDVLDYITHDEELEAVDEMAFSNRTLLANALLDTITSSEEYKLVRSYQEEIAKLDAGDKRLAQLKKDRNQLYKQEKPNLHVINELNEKDYTICAKYTKKTLKNKEKH